MVDVSKGFMSGVLKRAEEILMAFRRVPQGDACLSKKRKYVSPIQDLEEKLWVWFRGVENAHGQEAPTSDAVVMEKAKELGKDMGIAIDPKKFNYSSNWLLSWKKRYNIFRSLHHGEGSSANLENAELSRSNFRMLLKDVHPDLIFNFDESGLFFRMLPRSSLNS